MPCNFTARLRLRVPKRNTFRKSINIFKPGNKPELFIIVACVVGAFMRSFGGAAPSRATETVRQDWRETDTSVGDVLTNIAKRVLWPENTAPSLAAACGCSVRQAERFLGGHCEWSGDAVAAIMAEILKRRGIRNVRVKPR